MHTRSGPFAAVAAVIAVLVGGCSSAGTEATPTVASTSIPTVTVTTTVPPVAAATTTSTPVVVLGSSGGVNGSGYGTERPSLISLGSATNTVGGIVWESWGGPTATGTGELGIRAVPATLQAGDLGDCNGVLAYRTLAIGGTPQDICD
ncbi:MAG: hypothetical protein QM662_03225 [Gordonia sp. (in: high G+C Gram-positive bacteria)]